MACVADARGLERVRILHRICRKSLTSGGATGFELEQLFSLI
jgi:hypothetical protein